MNAVITGASKGIGRALATAFAAEGYNLFLCSRSAEPLFEAVDELAAAYPTITVKALPTDLSTKEGCISFANWLSTCNIAIDVLINNAGLYVAGSVYNEPEGQLDFMLNTNLYSAYHLTRLLCGKMITAEKGHIFNICSIASRQAYANGGSYSISKYAMLGFGENLRQELKPFNIKVTNVLPGAVLSNSWAGSNINPKRIMEAEDVAKMVVSSAKLSPQACIEEIIMRPQLGDL